MAKITVVLTSVMDDGKTIRQPGESVSMDEVRAQKLASLGMAKLPKKAAPVKAKSGAVKTSGAATPPPPPPFNDDGPDDPGSDNPDADGEGGEGGDDNV